MNRTPRGTSIAKRLGILALLAALVFETGLLWSSLNVEPEIIIRTEVIREVVLMPGPVVFAAADPNSSYPADSYTPEVQSAESARRFYDVEALLPVLGRTPWPVTLWTPLLERVGCESASSDPDHAGEVDARAEGDTDLAPLRGPSRGITQINIAAHPHLARTFDLYDPWEALIAAYIVYVEAGYSFSPWSCGSG